MTDAAPQPSTPPATRERIGPRFNELFDAFLGFDLRVVRTARDLIVRPLRVGRQAVTGTESVYLGQVRLFIVLMSLSTLFLAVTKIADGLAVETLFAARPELMNDYAAQLAERGFSIADVNDSFKDWFNLFLIPMNLLYIVVFAGLFRLMAPRYTFFGHAILYITAANASVFVGYPAAIAASLLFSISPPLIGLLLSVFQLGFVIVFVWALMRRTILGGVFKTLAVLVVYVLTALLTSLGIWTVLEVLADLRFGEGPIHFLINAVASDVRAEAAAGG